MATRNTYLAYKRDTSLLLRWMIQTSNNIIKSSMFRDSEEEPRELNRTGQITVADIVPLCRLIAKHVTSISPSIYQLFQSIIDARTDSHLMFQQIAANTEDKEIEESNSTHKFFIDTLVEAFEALGGNLAKPGATQSVDHDTAPITEEEVEQLIFANRFAALQVSDNGQEQDEEDGSSDNGISRQPSSIPQRKQTRPGRGKKDKRGKKQKPKNKQLSVSEHNLDHLPLESYKLIQDEDSEEEYMWAALCLVKEWMNLRHELQEVWRDVAYKNMNVAIGGTLSNFAIAMIQRTSRAIFVHFPEKDSYHSITDEVTAGVPYEVHERVLSQLWLFFHSAQDDLSSLNATKKLHIDVQEQLLTHAYHALMDFITDFQHTRSGKPTKRMLAELNNWDPNFNLLKATEKERLRWRRNYTINWLYDMVNLFSAPRPQHRKFLGLEDFASFITSLAMQKPGTDIRHKILPHHVFQLQLIVDSMTISRGWALNSLQGNMLAPPANSFKPEQDIKDCFLSTELSDKGLPARFISLLQVWGLTDPDKKHNMAIEAHNDASILRDLIEGLQNSLGQVTMGVWNRNPEPLILLHLHNMVHKRGYLKNPVELLYLVQQLFEPCVFPDGQAPSSKFYKALGPLLQDFSPQDSARVQRSRAQHQKLVREWLTRDMNLHEALDVGAYRIFNQKSGLVMYRDAKWDVDRIPDSDLYLNSCLTKVRLLQTKQIFDSVTGQWRRRDTELTRKIARAGMSEDQLFEDVPLFKEELVNRQTADPDKRTSKARSVGNIGDYNCRPLNNRELLDVLRVDIASDIMSPCPFSGFNYLAVLVSSIMVLREIRTTL
ncbi:hypothetical protein B0T21DRAFT_379397 [Apiosordaria backusii]|uniref:DUF6604 domain-containing protein n=1 Tax=Apiosordaria backusii TaxID=314023 RepID=A0AA40K622_9PEZI|nr:hypothetical protein B0T21DRAFT_379397 [Apiosordaria backusii]